MSRECEIDLLEGKAASDRVNSSAAHSIIMDNPVSFPCQLISWDEAYRLSRELARAIKSSRYDLELVVAIGRGGYVPARIVCDFLLHSLLTSIKIEHWDIAACKRPQASVRFPLAVDVREKKILIVDDVTDTGDTLKAAIDYVKSEGAGQIKTGSMSRSESIAKYNELMRIAEGAKIVAVARAEQEEEADDAELEELGEAAQLKGISLMPARVKCAELGWRTAMTMLDERLAAEGK